MPITFQPLSQHVSQRARDVINLAATHLFQGSRSKRMPISDIQIKTSPHATSWNVSVGAHDVTWSVVTHVYQGSGRKSMLASRSGPIRDVIFK